MKKTEIWEAYNKYLGPKCSRITYYNRILKGKSFIDALKPVSKEEWHPNKTINSKLFSKELEWYYQQEGEKINRQRFYQRLYQGFTKEEAIKVELPKKEKKPINFKTGYIRQSKPITKDSPDHSEITIKYNEDEASIIKNEYEKMMEDLEYKYRATDDATESKEISDKLGKLKIEYEIFCEVNFLHK